MAIACRNGACIGYKIMKKREKTKENPLTRVRICGKIYLYNYLISAFCGNCVVSKKPAQMPTGKEPTEMSRSMTAYGRATAVVHDREFTVEIKSVNNRYFDCSVRLPRAWSFMEGRIKAYLSAAGVMLCMAA